MPEPRIPAAPLLTRPRSRATPEGPRYFHIEPPVEYAGDESDPRCACFTPREIEPGRMLFPARLSPWSLRDEPYRGERTRRLRSGLRALAAPFHHDLTPLERILLAFLAVALLWIAAQVVELVRADRQVVQLQRQEARR